MQANVAQENWAGGELAPNMRGRYSLPLYSTGAERIVNFICETSGPARFRNGSQYVLNTRRNNLACLIPFQFNDEQAYEMEFTEGFVRFYRNNGVLVLTAMTIIGATQAAVAQITVNSHGYSVGDELIFSGIAGMTQLNNRSFIVRAVTTNTFTLEDNDGVALDSSGFDTYVSGGQVEKVYEIVSPYQEEDLFALKYAQNADVMYIVHRSYEPRKLTRSGALSWAIATYTRTADPFTSQPLWPGAIAFYQGRLILGGSDTFPESFWGSKPLDTNGDPQYDDFTIGPLFADAFKFTLSPSTGKVDKILSIVPTINFLAIATFEGIMKADGGAGGEPISPSTIDVTPSVIQGVLQEVTPILLGVNLVYIHRSGLILYGLEFDILSNSYSAVDKNLTNDHMTETGVIQMVYQIGRPTALWMVRSDGVLLSATYVPKENVNGWSRHTMGGTNSKVISVGVMPRPAKYDQIWVVVERTIAGVIKRSVEYLNDAALFPELDDYFTDALASEDDLDIWQHAMFEAQRHYVHSDSTLTYDGSIYGSAVGAVISFGPVVGNNIEFTASAPVFTDDMIGREIWKKPIKGIGRGRATIISVDSTQQVTTNITVDFDNSDDLAAGDWYLTTDSISGLWHLENENVVVVTDGGRHPDRVVGSGAIALQYQSAVVHVGLGYVGLLKSMAIEAGGIGGPAQTKPSVSNRLGIRFLNTLGAAYGTNLYNMEEVIFRSTLDDLSRPPPLFSGVKSLMVDDTTSLEKHIYIQQVNPLPCTVLLAAPFLDTDNS